MVVTGRFKIGEPGKFPGTKMAQFKILPDLRNDDDFNKLFEMKRYYLADIAKIIAEARIEKDELFEKAVKIDVSITKSTVRALKRNEPVKLSHAEAFASAINKILDEKSLARLSYQSDDAIHGAFFIIDAVGSEIAHRELDVSKVAKRAGCPETVVEAAKQGYRLTITTATDIVRAINFLSRQSFDDLDLLEVIVTDPQKGRRAAAKGCRADRASYVKWPPDTLFENDVAVATGRSQGNVRRLRQDGN